MPDFNVTFMTRNGPRGKLRAMTLRITASTSDNAKRTMRRLLLKRGVMFYEGPYAEMIREALSPREVADANHPVKRGADGRWVSACD